MIGMTCDTMPFNAGNEPKPTRCRIEFHRDFTAPMLPDGLRVGSLEPRDNEYVRETVALRQYCTLRVTVLNRFVERVLEGTTDAK